MKVHASSLVTSLGALLLLVGGVAMGPWNIEVMDGDTVRQLPFTHRLMRYDAAEIKGAKCPEEKVIGLRGKARLEELLAGAKAIELVRVTTSPDKYGRMRSKLTIDGEDVADIAIREGWGHPYDGTGQRPGWCQL